MKIVLIIKKILREPLFYLLALFAAAHLIIIPARKEILDVKITRNNKTEDIKLPYSIDMAKDEVFFISFNLSLKNKSAKFNIIPDDCIQEILINGENFPLDSIQGLCDYSKGIYFDFSEYAQEGLNRFELKMKNNGGGPGGIRIGYTYNGFSTIGFKQILFSVLLLIIAALILKKFKFGMSATLLVLLGIGIRLIYFSYTGPTERVYDMDYGHLVYMNMIIENKQIPKTDECWSCNHPPLYYLMGAGIKSFLDNVNPFYSLRFLQQISMLFSFASLAFGIALLYRLFNGGRFALLAGLLFVLWPGFVITAPRIGNDVPFYFGALMCMFFTQMWWDKQKNKLLLPALLGAAIAMMFKSTGFVIFGVLIAVYICGIFRFWKLPQLKIIAGIFIIAILSTLASQHRVVSDFFRNETPTLVSVRNVNPGLKVNTSFGSFVYFDMKDYLMEPYTSTWSDRGGRQYFWNFFIKSTMFGEYSVWNSNAGKILAGILNVLNLLFFLLILWGIINMKTRDLPSLLFFLALIASLIFTRAYYSMSPLQDFRYVAPILAPMLLFAVNGANILQNSRLRLCAYLCLTFLSVFSFLFIALRGFSV